MPNSDNEHHGSGGTPWMVTRREVMVSLAGLSIVVLTLILGRVSSSSVVLITPTNETVPFPDVEASFGRKIPTSGMLGLLYAANPSHACVTVQAYSANQTVLPAFLLIERGDCDFVTKVQLAQDAGYSAAIVYNNEMSFDLVTMSGNGYGIEIPAVFVSKEAGDILSQYVGDLNARLYILPALENTAWSVMAVSFISLLAVSAVLSTFFFVRRQRLRRDNSQLLSHDSPALTKGDLKAFPVSVFNRKDNMNLETCAICLEEYVDGEKLRVLPCNHEFHVSCIDQWLTTRRPFCPICKRDSRNKDAKPIPSESTPLLTAPRHADPSNTSSSTSASANDSAGEIC
ncbi:hypothetical protein GOP47_0013196 [Adiantum capillus-veneris]|uniref:RING-type E3 ubiquitin transferase n=1 Tax=Adiantum capillus-veneris TaxID=13818 RepID=A0A9D4ZF27_ADICA|nr:hypothetical protein GOP47_0013196 [Adiantum capillus-veneris]